MVTQRALVTGNIAGAPSVPAGAPGAWTAFAKTHPVVQTIAAPMGPTANFWEVETRTNGY
ncbi:hypothetical protein GCM10009816_22390 [Microbacterium aquimaris]